MAILAADRWLRRRKAEDSAYQSICSSALKRGAIRCALLVVCFSAVFYAIQVILVLLGVNKILIEAYYNFIVLALAEELAKYKIFKGLLRKNPYPYTWLDITSLMMIEGIGFEITEAVVYAIGANAGMMLVRGITVMHCGYGFIMGYFLGKGMTTQSLSPISFDRGKLCPEYHRLTCHRRTIALHLVRKECFLLLYSGSRRIHMCFRS